MKLVLPDLRTGGRRNNYIAFFGPWLPLVVFAAGIAALFTVVTLVGDGVSSGYRKNVRFWCDPNGKVRYQYSSDEYAEISPYWDGTLFFSVTMGFHGLSFVQARAIDLCFDAIVGRGSQILAAFATYPIFRRAVLRSMEVRELSLALLIPFYFEKLTFSTVWSMMWNMRSSRQQKADSGTQICRHKSRIDWRIVLVILTSCYILALPTLLGAMTSYQARSAPFIPINNNTQYLSTEELQIPNVMVTNGDRVGLWSNYTVYNRSDTELAATCVGYVRGRHRAVRLWYDIWNSYLASPDADLPSKLNVTDKTSEPPHWTYTLWPRNATLNNGTSSPDSYPNPNIPDFEPGISWESSILVRNKTYDLTVDLQIWSPSEWNPIFAYGNETLTSRDVLDIGKCLPSDGYIWGFSSIMLFTCCMLTIVIAIFLITLHYDAYCNSSADRYKLNISPYRDVLDLAAELRAHYGDAEAESMPPRKLDKAMREDPAFTGLEKETLLATRMARWRQQANGLRSLPTWHNSRKRSGVASDQFADPEESLISIGPGAQGPEIEMQCCRQAVSHVMEGLKG